ncbi:MAG: glycosyltransferase family 4 protein [Anaerolineae bacterium]
MRIAFLLPMSLESPSGLRYLGMAKALSRLGHPLTLLVLHHDLSSAASRSYDQEGVQVRYVGQMLVRKVGNLKVDYPPLELLRVALASTWRMMVETARLRTDLVHLGKPQPINGLAGLLSWRFLRGRPFYVDCDDYEAESNRFAQAWMRRLAVWFEDGLPRLAAGVTINTHFSEDRYLRLGIEPGRIAYVPNGVDRERFVPPPSTRVEMLRDRWEVRGKRVVGYIGTLGLRTHALDLLLEAFALLLTDHPDAVLLLVGGGEDYDTLQREVEERGLNRSVRFVGRVPPAETPAYYALAEVMVDPVHPDLVARARSPLKIVESLALGIPVVTGDVGDRREMLAEGKAGLLVPPGDAQALAEGLAQVLDHPDLARTMREAAVAQREQFYWDRLVDRIVQLYERTGG